MKKLLAALALGGVLIFYACDKLPTQARVCASVDTTATAEVAFDECVDIEQVQ